MAGLGPSVNGEFVFCLCGEGDTGGVGDGELLVLKEMFWKGKTIAGLGLAVWGAEVSVGVDWGEFRIISSGTETVRSLGVSASVVLSVAIGSA